MINELIQHVLNLMRKHYEFIYFESSNNYSWLSYQRPYLRINAKDEIIIRRIAQKLTQNQSFHVMKQLTIWYREHRNFANIEDIPKHCITLLNLEYSMSVIQTINNNRMQFFREILNITRKYAVNLKAKF